MGEELGWDKRRKDREWKDSVRFLASMGLAKSKMGVSRRDVESGRAGEYDEHERKLYSRHGKRFLYCGSRGDFLADEIVADAPADTMESDSIFVSGEKPVLKTDSGVNK